MRHVLAAISATCLTGCATVVPAVLEFPAVPASLQQPCAELQTVNTVERKMSDVLIVVSKNYAEYHKCSAQVTGWISWYNTNKEIHDKFKESKLEK